MPVLLAQPDLPRTPSYVPDGVRRTLTIFGTIQPGPLGVYLNQAIRGGTGDDGLMQRFQLSVWPDDPGQWRVVDRPPDKLARNVAFDVF